MQTAVTLDEGGAGTCFQSVHRRPKVQKKTAAERIQAATERAERAANRKAAGLAVEEQD
jgi:hypothetical protein